MKRKMMSRRSFLLRSITCGSTIMSSSFVFGDTTKRKKDISPVGMQISETLPETVYQLKLSGETEEIRLLQFTDIHFNPMRKDKSVDEKTKDLMKRLVELTGPHLLAITGDVWNENPFGQGLSFLSEAVEFFETLGIPWLYTWGNHDMLSDYAQGHDILSRAKYSMYRGGLGMGNYEVVIVNDSGGKLWRFVCLNSSSHGLLDEQHKWILEWTSKNQDVVPTFMVCHIPIYQYHTIWEGKVASGVKFEKVCYEKEQGETFSVLKLIPGLKACICGHDHLNDYAGILDGIDLIYGRATGFSGYGGDYVPKGGKLYKLYPSSGTYEWDSITGSGKKWRPERGKQIDKKEDLPWLDELES